MWSEQQFAPREAVCSFGQLLTSPQITAPPLLPIVSRLICVNNGFLYTCFACIGYSCPQEEIPFNGLACYAAFSCNSPSEQQVWMLHFVTHCEYVSLAGNSEPC